MTGTETIIQNQGPDSVTQEEKPVQGRNWSRIVERISYQGVVSNMPYLMFITLLCILYITNNNRAISLTRNLNEKTKELKELRWRYMDLQSRLMYQTSESQLKLQTESLGLKPLEHPAFEVRIKPENKRDK